MVHGRVGRVNFVLGQIYVAAIWLVAGSIVLAPIVMALGLLAPLSTRLVEVLTIVLIMTAPLLYYAASLAICVRRLHDLDRSAWQLLWLILPITGLVLIIYLLVAPGQVAENRYGRAPGNSHSFRAATGISFGRRTV